MKGDIVPNTIDRRTFLTHSAATVGGAALAGTVVDTLVADVAGATTGVNTGTPVTGGTLKVGVTSDAPIVKKFTGQTGKWDAAGFCVGVALYDPLFVTNKAGTAVLPCLALSAVAVAGSSFKKWNVTLRQNVKFHDNTPFNADAVVANFQAANADTTVGQALYKVLVNCTKVSTYVVQYTTFFPYFTFPFSLAEQQIAFMANPTMFAPVPSHPAGYTFNGLPNGTGPFVCSSWTIGSSNSHTKNANYWRKDSANRSLPYLNGITFIVQPDAPTRILDLQSGTMDVAVFFDGVSQKQIRSTSGVSTPGGKAQWLSDLGSTSRSPAMNSIMCNVTGKDYAGNYGTQDTSGTWTNYGTGGSAHAAPTSDIRIRQAMAHAINRPGYLSGVDQSQGAVSDGIFTKTNAYYLNPGYPALSVSTATSLVNAYKTAKGIPHATPVTVHIQTVSGSTSSINAFNYVKNQLAPTGIALVSVPLVQSTLINNAIFKTYECTQWAQFGGVVPDLNYVWWTCYKNPFGSGQVSGFVNFANNVDTIIENDMLAAVATSSATTRKAKWQAINKRFAIDLPYIWLDTTVSLWAVNPHVQNWANAHAPTATSVKSTQPILSPNGGVMAWAEIWIH